MSNKQISGILLCTLAAMLALCFFTTGCSSYKAQTGQDIVSYTEMLNETVESLQEAVVPLVQNLNEQGVVDDKVVQQVSKVSGEIDVVQGNIKTVTDQMADYQYEDGTVGMIDTARTINRWTSAFNPFSGTIDAILLAITGIASVIARKKGKQVKAVTKEKEQVEFDKWLIKDDLDESEQMLSEAEAELHETRTALKETIQGVQKAKDSINSDTGALQVLKDSLREKQKSPTTPAKIAEIKAQL